MAQYVLELVLIGPDGILCMFGSITVVLKHSLWWIFPILHSSNYSIWLFLGLDDEVSKKFDFLDPRIVDKLCMSCKSSIDTVGSSRK